MKTEKAAGNPPALLCLRESFIRPDSAVRLSRLPQSLIAKRTKQVSRYGRILLVLQQDLSRCST